MSPIGGKSQGELSHGGSSERAFNESKAHLDAILVAERELKAAKDKF
jgi:hypothetical protein